MTFSDSFGKLFQNLGDLAKLARDENFRKFLSNPKVQTLMQDEEFRKAVQEKNAFKLMAHREFAELLKDPEVRSALEGMQKKYNHPS